jgi:hypothetical protein
MRAVGLIGIGGATSFESFGGGAGNFLVIAISCSPNEKLTTDDSRHALLSPE